MAEEGKKISFGFSKSVKKPVLKNVPAPEQKKVDYIECLDDKSIKIVGGEEKKNEPLVIPMLGSKTWHDRIVNKTDADIFETKAVEEQIKTEPVDSLEIKKEPNNGVLNGDAPVQNNVIPMEVTEIKSEPGTNEPVSLEEQAAREIIADLNEKDSKSNTQVFTVPINQEDDLHGKEESTLEDYESIPIEAFGEAMLRGMGWQPGKGIGKNEKVVAPVLPELRPKGMGLGADKVTIQRALGKVKNKNNEELQLVKNSYVKIVEGKHSGTYATVISIDDDIARVFVKLALTDEILSISQYWIQPVTSTEFAERSKVLNNKTYNDYKEKEVVKKEKSSRSSEDSEDSKRQRDATSKKKSKKKRYHSSDDDSSPERKSRKKRSSSSSDEEPKPKKSKKSKKHKSRDSSSERASRKNRKKDKEREKSRHKKSDYSDASERARNRDRKRSRSRSHSPKSRRKGRSRSRSPRR